MKEQYIHIDEFGDKRFYSDKKMTRFHREDGPAIENVDRYKAWYLNGKLHRIDGPAVEYIGGNREWFLNGKRHREDGPALEYADGYKAWYLNGKRHREDGPAVEHADGSKKWFLSGKPISEQEHARRTSSKVVLTLDEIADKLGICVDKLTIKK